MLKIQCRCGHKIAVPTEYAGKRIKCPRCEGPVLVPMGSAAQRLPNREAPARQAARAPAGFGPRHAPTINIPVLPGVDEEVIRQAKLMRQAKDERLSSANSVATVIIGFIVVIAFGVMLYIVLNYRSPDDLPRVKLPPKSAEGPGRSRGWKPDSDEAVVIDPAKRGPSAATQRYTVGNDDAVPLATTSTFDAATGMTTIESLPTTVLIGQSLKTMLVTVKHDGKDIRQVTRLSARISLKGDFTGLVHGGLPDVPVLIMEIDGREYPYKPTLLGGDERIGQNEAPVLANKIEYELDRPALAALARGSTIQLRLDTTPFALSPEQLAMFRGFVPGEPKAKPTTTPKTDEQLNPERAGQDEKDGRDFEAEEMKKEKEMRKK